MSAHTSVLVDRARALRPLIEEDAPTAERESSTTKAVVDALAESELFWILVPRELGGAEAGIEDALAVFEELAYAATNLDRATVIDKNGSSIKFQPSIQPEPSSNVVRNDGQPRVETLQRGLLDQQRINPPIQSPGQAPHSSGGKSGGSAPLIPMLGGDTAHPDKEGR